MLKALEGSNKPFVFTSGTLMMARGKLAREDDGPDMAHPVSRIRGANEAVVLGFAERGSAGLGDTCAADQPWEGG